MNRIIFAIVLAIARAGVTSAVHAQESKDLRSPPSAAPSPVPACRLFLPLFVVVNGAPAKSDRYYGVCGLGTDGNGYVIDWDAGKAHDEALARQGDAEAMEILCHVGAKTEQFDWCRKSAAAGSADAMNAVGFDYLGGIVAPYDLKEAVRWFRMAADHGQADASLRLAALYEVGLGVERDPVIAESWRQKAGYQTPAADARAPDQCSWREGRPAPLLMCETANAQFDGQPSPYVLRIAFDGLTEHTVADAEAGEVEAMDVLGSFYLQTAPLVARRAEREQKGLALLKTAADRGDPLAPYLLGYAYEHNLLSGSAPAEALHWYRLAADRHSAPALMALGLMYAKGEQVPVDGAAAGVALEASAVLDPRHAARILATWHADGRYVAQSDAAAFRFFRAAAEAGDPEAMCPLADIYASGKGVPADETKAIGWRRASAKAGSYCKPEGYDLDLRIKKIGEPTSLEHCALVGGPDPHTGGRSVWCHPDDMAGENMQLVYWPVDDLVSVQAPSPPAR